MKFSAFAAVVLAVLICRPAPAQQLFIDFNSTSQDNGPHPDPDYQSYDAAHETPDDFVTQEYDAFGATVGVTPAWPNTTGANVQQMIDRGSGFDDNWTDTNIDLVTDWLGIDTRTGNMGNGDWDGASGTPTYMTLTLSGLPSNPYAWKSYHHDTEHVHAFFEVMLSTDGGTTFTKLDDGYMSDSAAGGNPDSATDGSPGLITDFEGMLDAGSIYETVFTADGVNDVVFQFAPYSGVLGSAVHNQLFGINGFELTVTGVAGDVNGDEVADIVDYEIIRDHFQTDGAQRSDGDLSGDGIVDHRDFRIWKSARTDALASGQSVPEPAGWLLAAAAVCGLAAARVRATRLTPQA
ncbi:MAG: dockerin type I domain-containing protein [Planctomycetota bacterium]